jgi:DNA-binding NarL/FixJ family response regulator
MPISLALIDDHRIFVEGLRSILLDENGFRIVHEYYSDHIPPSQLSFTDVDVILLDISLGGSNGIDLCCRIRGVNPQAKIIFFSMIQQQTVVLRALRSGALGYVLKSCYRTELFEAIRLVNAGRPYYSTEISQIIHGIVLKTPGHLSVESVTPREQEILYYVVNELSNHEIAEKLGISAKTVEIHRMRLLSKFGVKNTAGLVRKAIELNMLSDNSLI